MMQIACKNCGHIIPPEDINIQQMVAKCSNCGRVFSIADAFPQSGGSASSQIFEFQSTMQEAVQQMASAQGGLAAIKQAAHQAAMNADVPRPDQILQAESNGSELRLSYGWHQQDTWTKVLVAIIIDIVFIAILVGFMLMQMPTSALVLLALTFIPIMIVISYSALAEYFNITTFIVDSAELRIKNGPFPAPGTSLLVADIQAVFRKRIWHTGKYTAWSTYDVRVMTRDGKNKRLAGNLQQNLALYIEQQLDRFLHLPPQPEQ